MIQLQVAIFHVKGPEWVLVWYPAGSVPLLSPALGFTRQPFN